MLRVFSSAAPPGLGIVVVATGISVVTAGPDDDVVTGLSVVVVDGGVVGADVVVEVVEAGVVDGEELPVVDGADPSSLHHIQQ